MKRWRRHWGRERKGGKRWVRGFGRRSFIESEHRGKRAVEWKYQRKRQTMSLPVSASYWNKMKNLGLKANEKYEKIFLGNWRRGDEKIKESNNESGSTTVVNDGDRQ